MAEYRIELDGELHGSLAGAFDDLSVRSASGRTVLEGEIVDQARLYGLLWQLQDLGIEIVAVTQKRPKNGVP